MYNPKSSKATEFIDDQEILDTLAYARENKHNKALIDAILEKAKTCKGLSHREAAVLLECDLEEENHRIFSMAKEIKQKFYGNRIVMFAPLYLSNYCINGCTYCPYHQKNKTIPRHKLTQEEIEKEVIALQDMGHKRLALETGEHPIMNPIEYVLESIRTIYGIKHKNGAIRRVNVNIAATTVENYRKLKEAGIGTYIHDVGCGVLFGLNLYRYDFVGLLMHAEHLEAAKGVGPHTISVPRIRPADDIDPETFSNAISDDVFKKIVAVLRIAVPYTGLIISTRESQAARAAVLELGVSQISGGSRTSVGGYTTEERHDETAQFDVSDTRTLDQVVNWLLELGYIPSFCTACYREGRTGDRFMKLVKSGQIANCCQPNAIMTLKEYLEDYASPDTKAKGEKVIEEELKRIPNDNVRRIAAERVAEIHNGRRDFRF